MPVLDLERSEMTARLDRALDHMTITSKLLRNRVGGVQAIRAAGDLEASIRELEQLREAITIADRAKR